MEIPWDKIFMTVISVAVIWALLQALSWGYITAEVFLTVVFMILAAFGIGVTAYSAGEKAGEGKVFKEFAMKMQAFDIKKLRENCKEGQK